MPDCEKILNLIPLYIDNMLSDEENDEVLRHLKTCKKCQSELEYLKSIIDTTKDIPEIDLPKDFHKNLMEKAEKIERTKKKKRYITLRHISTGVAAAALIAISFVALGEISEHKETKQPDQYITSRLSDEPIQKDARDNADYDNDVKPKERNLNKESVKSAQTPKDAATEVKETQVVEQIPASISVADEVVTYTIATLELTEEIKEEVLEILSQYEKDEKGYIVPNIKDVIEKTENLGAIVDYKTDSAITQNYIIIK